MKFLYGIAMLFWTAAAFGAMPQSFDLIFRNIGDKPAGPGYPVTNRPLWNSLASFKDFREVKIRAEAALGKNYRMPPNQLYLACLRSGDALPYERIISSLRSDLRYLALAECLDNRGRYLFQIENLLRSFCELKSWVLPQHDPKRYNYSAMLYDIDANAALLSWDLATALWLFENKIRPDVRDQLRDCLRQRLVYPFRDMIAGKRRRMPWMLSGNDRTPVCLAGIAGTVMATVQLRRDRAYYLAACVDLSRNYVNAFPPDGYCSGGLASWSYGFGHYLMLGEMLARASGGGIKLLQDRKAVPMALYPDHIRLTADRYPDFGSGNMSFPDSDFWLGMRDCLMGHPSVFWQDIRPRPLFMSLPQTIVAAFFPKPRSASPLPRQRELEPYSYFPSGGVLISRPGGNRASCRLTAAVKAVGTDGQTGEGYGVVLLLCDDVPILTIAPDATTGPIRKKLPPLPVIDATAPAPGAAVTVKLSSTRFIATSEQITLDLAPLYPRSGAAVLTRTCLFSREKAGRFTITDAGRFARPVKFETSFITPGHLTQPIPGQLLITHQGKTVKAEIDSAESFELRLDPLVGKPGTPGSVTRLIVRNRETTAQPEIRISFTPVTVTAVKTGKP